MKIYLRGTILYQNKTKQNTKQKTNTDLRTVLISWMSARMYLSIEDMVFLQVFFFSPIQFLIEKQTDVSQVK